VWTLLPPLELKPPNGHTPLGCRTERIVTGINTVDMEWYRTQALRWESSAELQRARERYPVEGLLLYAGRLLPHKNVAAVLHALALAGTPELGLLIIGTGPEQPALQELCRRLEIAQRVWFLPPQPPEQLPFYYVLADALVLPSRIEPWDWSSTKRWRAGCTCSALGMPEQRTT
jgi:glycosyltransferase involved in cell wall biosynthesis